MKTARMTAQELVNFLKEKKGATILTIETATDPKLKKTGNPFKKVTKLSTVNGVVNYDYEHSVNLQREREGIEADFEAEARPWGTRLSRAFVGHKGNLYLTIKVEKAVVEPRYINENGVAIPKEEIIPFLPADGHSNRQETEKEIIHRDYSIGSITNVITGGVNYTIVHVPGEQLVF